MPKINVDMKTVIMILSLLFGVGTYVATQAKSSGEQKQKIDTVEMNYRTHEAWSQKKAEELEQTNKDVAEIKGMLKLMLDDLKEIKRTIKRNP